MDLDEFTFPIILPYDAISRQFLDLMAKICARDTNRNQRITVKVSVKHTYTRWQCIKLNFRISRALARHERRAIVTVTRRGH